MALIFSIALACGTLIYLSGPLWGASVTRGHRLTAGLLTLVLGSGVGWVRPYPARFWWIAVFVGLLVVVGLVDRLHQIIPNRLVALMAMWALLGRVEFGHWASSLVLAVGVFLFYLVVNVITRGGLGMGDVKFSGVLALALGYPAGAVSVISGLWAAGFYALFLLVVRRRGKKDLMALGPFLAFGGFVGMILMLHN